MIGTSYNCAIHINLILQVTASIDKGERDWKRRHFRYPSVLRVTLSLLPPNMQRGRGSLEEPSEYHPRSNRGSLQPVELGP